MPACQHFLLQSFIHPYGQGFRFIDLQAPSFSKKRLKVFENLEKDRHNEFRARERNVEFSTRNAYGRSTAFVAVKNPFSSIFSRLFLLFSSIRFFFLPAFFYSTSTQNLVWWSYFNLPPKIQYSSFKIHFFFNKLKYFA